MRFVRENSLSLFFGAIFLLTLAAQSVVGQHVYNAEALAHGESTYSYLRYITSSEFGEAVMENWESEFLQFTLFILATVWLVQKGSPESKKLGRPGLGTDEEQRAGRHARKDSPAWAKLSGWRRGVYEHSLLLVMGAIFLAAWLGHSFTGWTQFNNEQEAHGEAAVSYVGYLSRPEFWEQSFQNWQSEFLAVGAMIVLSIFLRARGSPESKPVGAPHGETGSTG
jgi:Domain of unknown function (DUF6766)